MRTRSDDLAFPFDSVDAYGMGLSKREYFAAMAMQGLLSHSDWTQHQFAAQNAVIFADKLIEELNKNAHVVDETYEAFQNDQ